MSNDAFDAWCDQLDNLRYPWSDKPITHLTGRDSHAPVDSRDARIEALKIALRECADDLESEIKERYRASIHPAMQRKYDKDMAPVIAARKLLNDEK